MKHQQITDTLTKLNTVISLDDDQIILTFLFQTKINNIYSNFAWLLQNKSFNLMVPDAYPANLLKFESLECLTVKKRRTPFIFTIVELNLANFH